MAELTSQLIGQRIIKEVVKLPMSAETAAQYIEAAVRAEVTTRRKTYVDSPELQKHIMAIAKLLTEPSPMFGIMLCGGVGNGKSTMMKALQRLLIYLQIEIWQNTSFETLGMKIVSAKELSRRIRVDSKNSLQFQDVNILGIDDLGEEEPEVMDYGNRVTPLIDLLSYRYDRMLFTMVTTNLIPQQIRSTYGDRIADRFNEMMLIIPYTEPSFRSPQQPSSNQDVTDGSDH